MANTAFTDDMLTTAPGFRPAFACATICRAAACATRNAPFRLTRSTASKSASEMSRKSAALMTAALFTSTSRAPNAATVAATMASTSAFDPTSQATNRALAPNSLAAASPASRATSAITTCAPSATKRPAHALPMPFAPPVISATLPSSLPIPLSSAGEGRTIRRRSP